MTKLRNPLLSLGAVGGLAKVLAFTRRRRQNIVETKPIPSDARSSNQLAWRHMYQKCTDLWHLLSTAEKQEWESAARPKHMTGYAWYMSQCLRPNPGIYLPLQGGTMQGDIDMAKFRLLKLPLPTDSQEPLTLAYYTANIAPYLLVEGARVYTSAEPSIPNATFTVIGFDLERWDNDTIHDPVIINSRLTCKTPGKYIIAGNIQWYANATGVRYLGIKINGIAWVALTKLTNLVNLTQIMAIATVYELALNNFVELFAFQDSGAPLSIAKTPNYSPEFMMQRIGT